MVFLATCKHSEWRGRAVVLACLLQVVVGGSAVVSGGRSWVCRGGAQCAEWWGCGYSFLQILNAEPVQDASPLTTVSFPLWDHSFQWITFSSYLTYFGVFILYIGPFLLYTRVCNSCVPFSVLPVWVEGRLISIVPETSLPHSCLSYSSCR